MEPLSSHKLSNKRLQVRTLGKSVNKTFTFLFLNQNICCRYSKEPSQWDGCFEHPKHTLKLIGKKIFTTLRIIFCLSKLVGSLITSGKYIIFFSENEYRFKSLPGHSWQPTAGRWWPAHASVWNCPTLGQHREGQEDFPEQDVNWWDSQEHWTVLLYPAPVEDVWFHA